MFALVVFVSVFSTKPRDWLGRTSLEWPIFCQVGRKTLTQSINSAVMLSVCRCSWQTFCQWWSFMTCCIRRRSLCLCQTSRAHLVHSRWPSHPSGFIWARRHRTNDCRGQYHTRCPLTSSTNTSRFLPHHNHSAAITYVCTLAGTPRYELNDLFEAGGDRSGTIAGMSYGCFLWVLPS